MYFIIYVCCREALKRARKMFLRAKPNCVEETRALVVVEANPLASLDVDVRLKTACININKNKSMSIKMNI